MNSKVLNSDVDLCQFAYVHSRLRGLINPHPNTSLVLLGLPIATDRFESSTTRRLTNQWNGKLTWSCGWLRQSSAPGQFPLISDVRRRREITPNLEAFEAGKWMVRAVVLSDRPAAGRGYWGLSAYHDK